jgi:hypothetical protein
VTSFPTKDFEGLDTRQRREKVVRTVREVLAKLGAKKRQAKDLFASAARIEMQTFRHSASDRWDLTASAGETSFPPEWVAAAELLETRQGVTPGGCLEVFLLDEKTAEFLGLEQALIHKAIKSKELQRWSVEWKGRMLFYPYHVTEKGSEPAFTIQCDEIGDDNLKKCLTRLGMEDSLNFNQQIDSR